MTASKQRVRVRFTDFFGRLSDRAGESGEPYDGWHALHGHWQSVTAPTDQRAVDVVRARPDLLELAKGARGVSVELVSVKLRVLPGGKV